MNSLDLGEIHSRLFDHRPVLHGEIAYFVKEFEEKRKNREEERLKKTLEHVQELSETTIPRLIEPLDKNMTDLSCKAILANEICNKVLSIEEEVRQADTLTDRRDKRAQMWSEFMIGQCEKSAKVDEDYEKQVAELKAYYSELENKLQMTPVTP